MSQFVAGPAVAAMWSEDQHSAFALEGDGTVWEGRDPAWANFIKIMQVVGDFTDQLGTGDLYCVGLVTHRKFGNYVVTWSAHLEGRGPDHIQYVRLMSSDAPNIVGGPTHYDIIPPDSMLNALCNEGLWLV